MSIKHILSTKLTSENYQNVYYAGFYDKVILNAKPLSFTKVDFRNHLKSLELEANEGAFRKGGMRFEVFTERSNPLYVKYNYSTGNIAQFILNPSHYSSYKAFAADTFDILGGQELVESLPILRLDKTVDITLSFVEVMRGLSIKHKRSARVHGFSSGSLTGLEIGKAPEVIKLYDRSKKGKLPFSCTRLEACCTRDKVEFPNLKELRKTWEKSPNYKDKTYQNLTFNNIIFPPKTGKKGDAKAMELEVLCAHFPYPLIRSCLNKNSNFSRDYGPYHLLRAWKAQPMAIFNTGVRNFFKTDEIEGE